MNRLRFHLGEKFCGEGFEIRLVVEYRYESLKQTREY